MSRFIWFGSRAVDFLNGGNTGAQRALLDSLDDFATRAVPGDRVVDVTGSEWQQFLAFTATQAEIDAFNATATVAIDLSDGIDAALPGQVDSTGDLRVGSGITAHNIADMAGGGRLVDTTSTLDATDDPVVITGLGKATPSVLGAADMEAVPAGASVNRMVFSNDAGFGLLGGSGWEANGNATRLNDGESINFALQPGETLGSVSFTVKVAGGGANATHVVIDSDGATIRDENGAGLGGFVQDASPGELDLGALAHGTKVQIDFAAETILLDGIDFAGDAGAFFAVFANNGSTDITLGSRLGNQVGWTADDVLLVTAEPPAAPAVMTFDDIPIPTYPERVMPADYEGFAWSQAGVFDVTGYGGTLGYRASSGQQIAFFAEAGGFDVPGYDAPAGSPLVISRDDTDFTVVSAQFSAANPGGVTVTARAFDNDILVGTQVFFVADGDTTLVGFGDAGQRFAGIDRLELSATDYFGFDDFIYYGGG
jgi:hypothetical protein